MLNTLPILFLLLILPWISNFFWTQSTLLLMARAILILPLLHSPFLTSTILNPYFFCDQISTSLVILTLWISALIILASNNIINLNNNPIPFTATISRLSLILVLAFTSYNLINFYILFERSLIPTLLLILRWGYQPERLQAGLYLMIYTITARLPLLLSLTIFFKTNHHLSIILPFFTTPPFTPSLTLLWWGSITLAFLVKAPIYLFHLWLPKAHVEAPIAGSIILAGLLLKLGRYGLLRIIPFFPNLIFKLSPFYNRIALWGGVITRFICLRQTDIKSLIAYSSIGHIALVIIGSTLLSPWGWQGSLIIIIAHGLCSSCLFSLANITYETTSTRRMFLTKGLLCLFPSLSFWWFILSIFNIAAPPTINLLAEINLFISALWASPFYMIPLGILRFLSATYSLYLYSNLNHGSPSQYSNPLLLTSPHIHTLSLLHSTPLILLILKPEIIRTWF